jgi:hypothetical protein
MLNNREVRIVYADDNDGPVQDGEEGKSVIELKSA